MAWLFSILQTVYTYIKSLGANEVQAEAALQSKARDDQIKAANKAINAKYDARRKQLDS